MSRSPPYDPTERGRVDCRDAINSLVVAFYDPSFSLSLILFGCTLQSGFTAVLSTFPQTGWVGIIVLVVVLPIAFGIFVDIVENFIVEEDGGMNGSVREVILVPENVSLLSHESH